MEGVFEVEMEESCRFLCDNLVLEICVFDFGSVLERCVVDMCLIL